MKSDMVLIAFLLSWILTIGQELTNSQLQQLDKITTQDVPKSAPGVATGIVRNGKIIYTNYAGYANLKDSIQIGKSSRFNMASNGKQFTAFAILMLEENRKLSLEDDFRKYLPNLYKNIQEPIKIKHLLNHSSGIRDVYDLWSLQGYTWWKQQFSNTDAMKLLAKQKDFNFKVGTKHSYSNSNYILLTQVIEKVTGKTFVEYTNQMFADLGMPNTSFVNDYKNIAAPIAKSYFNFNTWKTYEWTCNIHGDGNLFSTLEDQLQWEKLLQTKNSKVFSKEILAKSQELIANTNIENYGYGVEFGKHKDEKYRFHGGSTGAWKAITARFNSGDFAIVTMINSGKIDPMMQTLQMADVLLDKTTTKETFPIVPAKIGAKVSNEDILGIYRAKSGYIMKFEQREGNIYMIRSGRNDIKLLREADNIFYQWNDAAFKQEFTRNEDGIMQITAYYPSVKPFTLTKIESDLSTFDFTALNGSFQNSETNVSFTIKNIEKENYEIIMGEDTMKGLLLTENEMLVDGYNLFFEKDNNGNIHEILVTSGRIHNVRFVRKK
ncbi:serine hydrolase domain-containing protein [Kordia sp.]|uniref:serine hydrolase domain-containing protein n=1 Tax=Kordia sp. TaxID=1965332 RepID=UPI0025C5D097|nr:serine hydrolase domain-containing protein [Kordia sp.]MCH2194328.1 beta-lactamase family protein [Kordia sp.]